MRLGFAIIVGIMWVSPAFGQNIVKDFFRSGGPVEKSERRDYVTIRGFGSIQDQNNLVFENSRHMATGIGYHLGKNWRMEVEYAARNAEIAGLNGSEGAKGTFNSDNVGFNVYRDIPMMRRVKPFIGAGLGLGSMKIDFSGPADINPNYTVQARDRIVSRWWNAQVGINFEVTDNLSLGAGVEYFSYEDESIQSNILPTPNIDGINRNYNFYLSATAHINPH